MSEPAFVAHPEPVWRDRANYVIQVDLERHGMGSGRFEQLSTRTVDHELFELCCLPFFTYGLALGDVVRWNDADREATAVTRSGHRLVRVAFVEPDDGDSVHETFHGDLVHTGALVEFHAGGYAAIDIDSDERASAVLDVIEPFDEAGRVRWEWGDTQPEGYATRD